MRSIYFIVFGVLLVACTAAAQAPLTVGADGTLLRDGKPYRAIGVNVADAFWRVMANPADTSYEESFAALARHKIPFARIAASPYWPKDYALYINEPEAYFARLDGVVRAAERHGIGLVLSLHWAISAVPDLVGEPVNAWGRTDSKTIAFMREYTHTVARRYADSPAVWVWELGNEFSLAADVQARPPIVPELGTPAERSAADEPKTADMVVAWRAFGEAVREVDPIRPITTGNSLPRPPSERLRLEGVWAPLDSYAEMQANLARVTPDPVNVISVHQYRDDVTTPRFAPDHMATHDELVAVCVEAARSAKKALFIGEFGAPGADASTREQFDAMLTAFVQHKVALAAVWNFDWRLNRGTAQDEWNVTETNARSFVLDAIERANRELTTDEK